MSDQRPKKPLSRNRPHARGTVRDVLPPVTENESPLSRSLDELLLVKPAPIIIKPVSTSLDGSSLQQNDSVKECSSNESFLSAKSSENTEVPFEPSPSQCTLNPDVTNETLPSYDEDVFMLETLPQCCDNDVKGIITDILENAVDEESNQLVMSQDSLELAAAVSAAASSQALLETLTEDSNVQIQNLMRIRDDDLLANQCLKGRVQEYEEMKDQILIITQNLETTYSETFAEIQLTQDKEIEFIKLEASRNQVLLEKELEAVKSKLELAEMEITSRKSLEAQLNEKIGEFEKILSEKERHCKEELEGVIAKLMKSEIIASAKKEVEEEVVGAEEKNKNQDNKESVEYFQQLHAVLDRSSLENICFQTPPKSSRLPMPIPGDNLRDDTTTITELKKLCTDKERQLEKLQAENQTLSLRIQSLERKNEELQKVQSERNNLKNAYDALKTEMEEIRQELIDSRIERSLTDHELHQQLLHVCERSAKEVETLQNECEYFQDSTQQIQSDLSNKIKELNSIIQERDELLADVQHNGDFTKQRLATLETDNARLQNKLERINREMATVVDEKKNILSKQVALESTVADLRAECDNLKAKNRESVNLSNLVLDVSHRASLDVELQKLQMQFSNDPKLARLSDYLNWTSATEYMALPETKQKNTLEEDLTNVWTERCELEEQLANVIAENAVLRQRAAALDSVSRKAVGLTETNPSIKVWQQLRSCLKEIADELAILTNPKNIQNEIRKQESRTETTHNLFLPINDCEIQERSSPEGGRETPQSADEQIVNYYPDEPPVEAQNLDQSLNVLKDMVFELARGFNGEESLCDPSCSFNGTINGSFAEHLATIGAHELCQRVQQMKDEVARLFTLSQRPDLIFAKHQEEIKSLQEQVAASDKLVRSTRAFLDEQAADREVERDEACKKIEALNEAINLKERQLAAKERLEQDYETLETQLTEIQTALKAEMERREAAEEKTQQTLSKVGSLRDVIETLESQLLEKSRELEAVKMDNVRLMENLVQNGRASLEMEHAQRDSFTEHLTYIARLEEELASLRYKFEAVGPESLVTARNAIKDLEAVVARRTRDLELVQVAWNGGLSSASEEISTRDQVDATRCVTPDEMALEASAGLCEDVERLKERLVKHARVEEAAVKRIKDLEQIANKSEEVQVDLDVAMRRLDCLMAENERYKMRIEEERRKHSEKIVAPVVLEERIRELETQLERAKEEALEDRRKLNEKSRREEQLQASLEAYQSDLSIESSRVAQLEKQLDNEKSLRVAQESLSLSRDAAAAADFTGDSKPNKFWPPPSFVGDSLTPISKSAESVLRDAESARDIIPFDNVTQKPSWQQLSSVATLHLSPRGFSTIHSMSANSETHSSSSNLLSESSKPLSDDELKELSDLRIKENVQKDEIAVLKVALKNSKLDAARTVHELELAKQIAEEALKRVRIQAESAQTELELRKDELGRVNACLKEVAVEAEVDRERGLKLVQKLEEQLSLVKNQLKQQKRETHRLKKLLETSHQELETVKTHRADEENEEREKNRQTLLIVQAECEKLKTEKELVNWQLSMKTQELETLQQSLEFAEKEVSRLKIEKDECETRINAADLLVDQLGGKIKNLDDMYQTVRRDLRSALEEIEMLQDVIKGQTLDQEDTARMEKLQADVTNLMCSLKSNLSRSASLEAEVILVRSELDSKKTQVVALENQVQSLTDELFALNRKRTIENSCDTKNLMTKLRADDLAASLEKVKAELARSQTSETRLRITLETAVRFGREVAARESNLKKELDSAKREIVELKYLVDVENVANRGYERLCHHAMGMQRFQPQVVDPRSVRSAGDGEDRQLEWKWKIHRLESYRKALIWQKEYLQKNGYRAESHRRRFRRISLKTVAVMVVAILRMRFLTRRWKSRLPPLVSPPRRSERPLQLTSPPCKDPGFRVRM